MKSLIPLLVAAFVACTSVSSCTFDEILGNILVSTIKDPIRMRVNSPEFNSVDFTSDDFQFINFFSRDYPHTCGNAGDEFYVTIVRNMSTEGGDVVRLQLSLVEGKDQFEFGKKYILKETNYFNTGVRFRLDGDFYEYYVTDGWIVFTDSGEAKVMSGEFEFTALDKNSGNVMTVTNGSFDNLHFR